jgi:hypothetical protein
VLANRLEVDATPASGLVLEFDGRAERNYIVGLGEGGAVSLGEGILRNNRVLGAVRVSGPALVEHNTVLGPLVFGGEGASIVGNIVRTSTPLQSFVAPGSPPGWWGQIPPWEVLVDNDLVPGSGGVLYRAVSGGGSTFTVTTISELESLSFPVPPTVANGNFNADPLFSATWRLSQGSPCIDAGAPAAPSDVDFDGEARTGGKDVGADEYSSAQ